MWYFHYNWLLALIIRFIVVKAQSCLTPKHRLGECITLTSCGPLWRLFQDNNISDKDARFLRASECDFKDALPKVCCPLSDKDSNRLLPDIRNCGGSFQDKIFGGKATAPGELPWMALIVFNKPDVPGSSCGGALISKRYVLTAAHCVHQGNHPADWRLSHVRFGEYNLTMNPDCYFTQDTEVCAPSVIDIPVEEKIVHELFNPNALSRKHDIALLRLQREVDFTDYIRPICLPFLKELRTKNYENENLLVAGWGYTEKEVYSQILLQVFVSGQNNSFCRQLYKRSQVELTEGQMCAGGDLNKDSCIGDSGSPLITRQITENHANYVIAGIVSQGPYPCGQKGFPAIYTRVSEYVPWIIENLKP